MEVKPREIRNYQTSSGNNPFREWLIAIKDKKARATIQVRINHLRQGNFGDCKYLGEEINEFRIHYGPGYRIYFSSLEDVIIILLCAGTKRSQKQDIKRAKEYWRELKTRNL